MGGAFVDDRRVKIGALGLRKGEVLQYVYDLGDWWSHSLLVEEVEEGRHVSASRQVADVLDGAGACPPEDCEGPLNYIRMVNQLLGLHPHLIDHPVHTDGGWLAFMSKAREDYWETFNSEFRNKRNWHSGLELDPTR